jgi:hypothetical protein
MSAPANLPPFIRTDGSNPFAYHTMTVRQPKMLIDLLEANPDYPPIIADELRLLLEDLLNDRPIMMLNLYPTPTPDYIEWASASVDRSGRQRPTWLNTDWFYAETVLFRLIVEACRWWETRRDPYTPFKQEELNSPALWDMLERALHLEGGIYDRLPNLAAFAMWGNRIDLSYMDVAAHGTTATAEDLLVDDALAMRDHLMKAQLAYFPEAEQGVSHIIVDNAGTELAMDLALADALLCAFSDVVILHTKYHPTFVSDAINEDVLITIERLHQWATWQRSLRCNCGNGPTLTDGFHGRTSTVGPEPVLEQSTIHVGYAAPVTTGVRGSADRFPQGRCQLSSSGG